MMKSGAGLISVHAQSQWAEEERGDRTIIISAAMQKASKALKAAAQAIFYLAILALLISKTVSANISHDENQFIAPGQLLAYHGLLPYVDYPYTHMPYAIPFYALSAWLSEYDLLAGRLLNTITWLGCILLVVAISRALHRDPGMRARGTPPWAQLLWEFALVYAFVHHVALQFVLQAALNHSLAAFFSLLGAWFYVGGTRRQTPAGRAALLSGACLAAAGLARFNYASLLPVILVCWLLHGLRDGGAGALRPVSGYLGGALTAGLPALVLAAWAPRQFYYGNLVYIRLNTVYYAGQLRELGMSLTSKLSGFLSLAWAHPLDLLLYGVLLYTGVACLVQVLQRKPEADLARLGLAGCAAVLWMSAFAPTPALLQYLAAPLPFLFILVTAFRIRVRRQQTLARAAGALAVLAAATVSIHLDNPLRSLQALAAPSAWHPVQLHQLALEVGEYVPSGRVLALQSMVPLEAGLEAYGFTATGPFSWRTSLLLTPERRREYGVTSPEELPSLLDGMPPAAILVGFEAPNAGFERGDMGGLETPLENYAEAHGYTAVALQPPFWRRGLTLWLRP
jgi:hypothetical protein